MHRPPRLIPRLGTLVLLVAACAAAPLQAQQTGAVTGQVVDATTGHPLPDAGVRVEGTASTAISRADGAFLLPSVPAGTREVTARLLGYAPVTASVTVRAGSTASVVLSLDQRAIPLEPLVVEGEKALRDMDETFSSVGVLGAGAIQATAIDDLEEAFRLAANVRDADWVDAGIVIRGINSEGVAGPSGAPLATVYIDGVPQTQNAQRRGVLGAWDVQQIEVWRGPQSTLSGRNALAGKIEVRTKDPTLYWEAAAQAELGNQNRSAQAFMVSGPVLEDRLAFRVSAGRQHREGSVSYPLYEGDGFPRLEERRDDDSWLVRGKLLLLPDGEQGGLRAQLNLVHGYNSPAYRDVDGSSADASQIDRSGPVSFSDRYWGLQSVPVFVEARSTETSQAGLELTLPAGDAWTLSSTSSLTNTSTQRPSVDLSSQGAIDELEFSQELVARYVGQDLDATLGGFALDGTVDDERNQRRPWEDFERRTDTDRGYTNLALFGEVRWQLAGPLSLVTGARVDRETQDFFNVSSQVGPDGAVQGSSESATESSHTAFLPKVGLSYGWDRGSVGGTVQRALRTGGSAINFVTGEPYQYDSEKAWNYELALRHASRDGRLRARLNLFHLDWRDQQVNVPQVPGDFSSDIIVNAGESTVTGGELEVTASPMEALDVFGSLGVARTNFEDFSFLQFGNLLDLTDESFPQAPEVTAAVGGEWRAPGGFFLGGDVGHTGSALSRSLLEGGPRDELPSYTLLNLRAGWLGPGFTITGYLENATDEEFFLYRFDDPGFQLATLGKPRSFGIVVRAER